MCSSGKTRPPLWQWRGESIQWTSITQWSEYITTLKCVLHSRVHSGTDVCLLNSSVDSISEVCLTQKSTQCHRSVSYTVVQDSKVKVEQTFFYTFPSWLAFLFVFSPLPDYVKATVDTVMKVHFNEKEGDVLAFLTGIVRAGLVARLCESHTRYSDEGPLQWDRGRCPGLSHRNGTCRVGSQIVWV